MVDADNARAEAARRYRGDWDSYHGEPVDDWGYSEAERRAFVAGAEWAAGRAETTTEVPRLSIEDGYLVARVDRCTCEPHYGAHEIHCGIVDHLRLDNLPGWPGAAETTTEDVREL